jgi:hypothetical protein
LLRLDDFELLIRLEWLDFVLLELRDLETDDFLRDERRLLFTALVGFRELPDFLIEVELLRDRLVETLSRERVLPLGVALLNSFEPRSFRTLLDDGLLAFDSVLPLRTPVA